MKAVESTAADRQDRHLGYLDALRGIAILGVVLVHTAGLTRQHGRMLDASFSGQRGVQLFYIVSAFTLCLSLDSERREAKPLSNYFLRRFFRIAPMYYLTIVANVVLKYVAPGFSSLSGLGWKDVGLGFLFLSGVRPRAINSVVAGGWSIAVETTFYLVLPFLFRRFRSLGKTLILFGVTAPLLLNFSRHLAQPYHEPVMEQYFAFFWFPVEFPIFVLGMATYFAWKEHVREWQADAAQRRAISAMLLLGCLMLYSASLPFTDRRLYSSSFIFVPLIMALSIYPWGVLVNPVTRLLGKISFSVYLLHFFVLKAIERLLERIDRDSGQLVSRYVYGHALGLVPVYLAILLVTVPFCILSWRFIEQPAIRLGRRVIARREGRAAPRTGLVPPAGELVSAGDSRDAQF